MIPQFRLAVMGMALMIPAMLLGAEPAKRIIHSQPSVVIATPQVELAVTEIGGHMAPVTFYRDTEAPLQPYHVTPWQDEPAKEMPAPVLGPLRGDFFCMPFGGNSDPVNGEKHPPHGEIAGSKWNIGSCRQTADVTCLTMTFQTQVRPGTVTKELLLKRGHNVVYSRHTIKGFDGKVPLGHHATLSMPEEEGTVRLASSPIKFGMTNPGTFSDPRQREYQSLLPGAKWTDLSKVPVLAKDTPDADLTRMPARYGYADLVQMVNDPAITGPAWITATFTDKGYVWFALKDPKVLASTVFWIENHGRHGHPWNGRNHCLGIEDVTSHFADGLSPSIAENALSRLGVPTTLDLTSTHPTVINYIQGVARIPNGFDQVKTIEFRPGEMTLNSLSGKSVTIPVDHEFLTSGALK